MTVSWRGARSRATEPFPSPRLRRAPQPQLWQMAQGPGAVPDRECTLHDAVCPVTYGCAGSCWLAQALKAWGKLSISRVLTASYLASVLGSAALQPTQLHGNAVVALACAGSQG